MIGFFIPSTFADLELNDISILSKITNQVRTGSDAFDSLGMDMIVPIISSMLIIIIAIIGLIFLKRILKSRRGKISQSNNSKHTMAEEGDLRNFKDSHETLKPDLDNIRNLNVLRNRLEKGEITKDEYDDLKKEFL